MLILLVFCLGVTTLKLRGFMEMKKTAMSSLFLLAAGVGQYAVAATGTVDFEGEVTAETCYANVNGSGASTGSANALIRLPSIGIGALPAAGATAGTTRFTIVVSQDAAGTAPCAATIAGGVAASEVYAVFEAGPENDLQGRLVNSAGVGAAENVKLQLLNKDGMQILAGASGADASTAQRSTVETMVNARSPGLVHYVQYYATAPAKAGLVTGKAIYTLAYK